ncbi:MAG: hypothetical protein ACREIF_00120 [Chthoniobacterales bacterium]
MHSRPKQNRALPVFRWVLAFLPAGCAANQPCHPGEAPTEAAGAAKDIYRLGFIEFDEQGDFWDRDKLSRRFATPADQSCS